MRFLFNIHGYKPAYSVGGPIHSVSALAESLVARGHEVFVATSNRNLSETLDVDPTRVYDVDGVLVRYFRGVPNLLQRTGIPYFAKSSAFSFDSDFYQWLEEDGPNHDIFHTHLSFLSSSPRFAAMAGRLGRPYLYHQRGCLDPLRLRFRALKKKVYIALVEMRAMRRADALVALTPYEADVYRRMGLQQRVEVIPNGIARDYAAVPVDLPDSDLGRFLHAAHGRSVFTFLGRIHPIKGADVFAEAFIRHAGSGGDGVAVLAGPDEFSLVDGIRRRLAEAGLTDRMCIPGTVSGPAKIALLQRSHCFVLPTVSEGLSMAILEAMAAGCAILTSPGAHFDEVEECGGGRVVEKSVEAVLGAMESMSRPGMEGLREMGARGRKLVGERFTWEAITDQYLALCEELVAICRRRS